MGQLADALATLAAAGAAITLPALDLPPEALRDEVSDVAAGPYAPLVAEALTHSPIGQNSPTWPMLAAGLSAGLASQRSVLALAQSIELLLAAPSVLREIAGPLYGALLDDLPATAQSMPLLAATRLEGAVRLAIAGAVRPYRVWETLESLTGDEPEDFVERLPRILGVALDCWALHEQSVTQSARLLLERLSADEAADVDAMFELGCDNLRSALTATEIPSVVSSLTTARNYFVAASAAEEARDDAVAYAAVCDAVLGFAAGDPARVSEAAERITGIMERRAAWLMGTHVSTWLQPRLAAEAAWSQLVLRLRAASNALHASAWMQPWDALDAVLGAYRSARTVRPVGASGGADAAGLATLVEPAIEDRFLREQAFLAILRHAAANPDENSSGVLDVAIATQVLSRIASRETSATQDRSSGDDDEDAEAGPAIERLHRIAPTLISLIGLTQALHIAAGLDDDSLLAIEGVAHNGDVARLRASDPLIVPLLDRLLAELSQHPEFTGDVRMTFTALLEQTLLFLKSRSDLTRTSLLGAGKAGTKPYDYRRKPAAGERQPVEADLQRDFHHWLLTGPLATIVMVEPIDIALGRADVLVHFGALRYLTEIKKDADDSGRTHLESKYLTQAAEYTNTNAPFGQLLVLDLTPKTAHGSLRVDELTWLAKHRPPGAQVDRYVVVGVVSGNRITPSAYSR